MVVDIGESLQSEKDKLMRIEATENPVRTTMIQKSLMRIFFVVEM